jgi:hypothetical protein
MGSTIVQKRIYCCLSTGTLRTFRLSFHEKCIKAKRLDCYVLQQERRHERATILRYTYTAWPVPVAARSKVWVFGRSLSETVSPNPTGGMDVCCECCVLSGRGLCDGLITRPEESYRLWCVVLCDKETSKTRRLKPAIRLWKCNQNGL